MFSLSAVCGDDLPGDRCHVPRHHQRDDVPYWEPRPAHRGISELQRATVEYVDLTFSVFNICNM